MKWHGIDDFISDLDRMPSELEKLVGAHAFATANHMKRDAMANMSDMRIGLVTGRSRALFGTAYEYPDTRASAGYLAWPEEVEFYPQFLNDGTPRMISKPYFDLAYEQQESFFVEGMERALERVLGL